MKSAFKVITTLSKPLMGKGLGNIAPFGVIYRKIMEKAVPSESRIVEIEGFKMMVDRNDGIAYELLVKGSYEPCMTRVFNKLVKSDMVVIDVGANIGYYSLLASKLVGEKGEVIAFEPEKDNFDRLFGNCLLNRIENVFVSNMAVSDRKGQSVLYVSNRESGEHTLVPNPRFTKRKVQMVTLDSLFRHYHHVDIIKSDTEGHEIEILRGATQVINRNRDIKLFIEFNIWALGKSKQRELWELLRGMGFGYIYLLDDFKTETPLVEIDGIIRYSKKNKKAANLLCSRSMVDGI